MHGHGAAVFPGRSRYINLNFPTLHILGNGRSIIHAAVFDSKSVLYRRAARWRFRFPIIHITDEL